MMKKKTILIHGIPDLDFYKGLAERKDLKKVYVTEFRPGLWGAKLVCKELLRRKLTPILICDNMVGFCLEKKMLDEIHLFAESKDEHGAICFVGSLVYAICAMKNKAKVFVSSAGKVTRPPKESDILSFCAERIAAKGIKGYVPFWEFVPIKLISKIKE